MFKTIISKKLSTTALALLCCATLSSQAAYGMDNNNNENNNKGSNHLTVHQLDELMMKKWKEIPKETRNQLKCNMVFEYHKMLEKKLQWEDLSHKDQHLLMEYFSTNNINREEIKKYLPLLSSLHIGVHYPSLLCS